MNFFEEMAIKLSEKLGPKVGEQVESWVDKAVEWIDGTLVPKLDPRFQGLAAEGGRTLRDNRDTISKVAAATFVQVVHHLALGQESEARTAWLRDEASIDDMFKVLDENAEATQRRVQAEAEAWAAYRAVAQTFLERTGRIAVPMLIGLVL